MRLELALIAEAAGRMTAGEVAGLVRIDDEGTESVVVHGSGLGRI